MKIQSVFPLLVFLWFPLWFLTSCKCEYKLKCSDGNPVIVQKSKCFNKYYLSVVMERENKYKGTIDILDKIKSEADISTKTTVIQLQQQLDQQRVGMQNLIKSSLYVYNSSPCDPDVKKSHFAFMSELNKENTTIEQIEADLQKSLGRSPTVRQDSIKRAVDRASQKFRQDILLEPKAIGGNKELDDVKSNKINKLSSWKNGRKSIGVEELMSLFSKKKIDSDLITKLFTAFPFEEKSSFEQGKKMLEFVGASEVEEYKKCPICSIGKLSSGSFLYIEPIPPTRYIIYYGNFSDLNKNMFPPRFHGSAWMEWDISQ